MASLRDWCNLATDLKDALVSEISKSGFTPEDEEMFERLAKFTAQLELAEREWAS